MPRALRVSQFIRDLAAQAPASSPARKPRKRKSAAAEPSQPATPDVENIDTVTRSETTRVDPITLLPGTNPYDKAFLAGAISYAEAKVRDELHTRQEIAKLELEEKNLALEQRRLEIATERGNLIAKEDYLARQEALVSTFLDLLRLTTTEVAARLPAEARSLAVEEVTHRYSAALTALSKGVADRQPREVVAQLVHEAFRGE